jgi:CheY-like chemotaxis protein
MSLAIVLAVGLDPPILARRSLLLQSAGYIVAPASSVKEAADQFQAGSFDLVIQCHSIPVQDREGLTCLIRASGSLTPVICVAKSSGQHDAFPNATLDEKNPNQFLISIREVLSKAAKKPARTGGSGEKRESSPAQRLESRKKA